MQALSISLFRNVVFQHIMDKINYFKEAIPIMSTSKAKKARQKLVRQGLMNPDLLRGSWQGINPSVRTTPVLHDRLNKLHNKHKRNHANHSDDSFCVYRLITFKPRMLYSILPSNSIIIFAACSRVASPAGSKFPAPVPSIMPNALAALMLSVA